MSACLPDGAVQSEGHVAGAAAEIESAGAGALQDVAESAGGAAPPQAVNVEREQVVEQVVAGRDGGEHVAHGGGGLLAVLRAFGGGADDRLGGIRHGFS